ncbi:unnamed protein product [Spirodela intermedia]|uniref:Protein kinase domain-containing protein n=1 Tax=Spirodela intermedia TaxID=51605 RepID=A0A7I8JCV0_SPIIN|nr:unnamed protein product [Spirodela intermedia]CAA6667967.1 unnamed protein product [Spirodela intermedia]
MAVAPAFRRLLLLFLATLSPLVPSLAAAAAGAPLNDDVVGLIVFKSGVVDHSGALSSWQEDDEAPCATWAHIQCSAATGRVVNVSLSGLGLSGHLNRGLAKLSALESLSLAGNNFSGVLPSHLSLLPALRLLNLSSNAFSGAMPGELGALAATLTALDLSDNELSGAIPDEIFSGSLRYLSLAGNALSGPLPLGLSRCGSLLHLNLSGNRLSGEPDFAGSLLPLRRLRVLDLSRNELAGPVPEGMGLLHNLKVLRLNGNQFSGGVPLGIGYCPHLTEVDLSGNGFSGSVPYTMQWLSSLAFLNLSGNQLSADLPSWVSNLTSLQSLDLSDNRLGGSLPPAMGTSGSSPPSSSPATASPGRSRHRIPAGLLELGLEELDLSDNELTGGIPPGSTRLFETLRRLDLSRNRLTGDIPPEMALYFNLHHLNLSWNDLRSRLPPELGYFRNLSVLDLRSSALYGPIPGDLCDSGSLAVLQLDGNSLSGPIPEEIGNCSSLHLLGLSHNSLNGSIPPGLSRLRKLEILNLEFNDLSGEIPPELGALDSLLAVNISHNRLIGRLPTGGVFPSLDQSAIDGNAGICSPLVHEPCRMNVPKPLVLDPDSYRSANGGPAGDLVGASGSPSSAAVAAAKARHRRFLSVSAIVAISAALVIVLGVVVVALLNASARRRVGLVETALESMCSSSTRSGDPAVGKLVLFGPRSELLSEDFGGSGEALLHKATEIGRGAFGTVYKAAVASDKLVAVKKLLTANIVQYHDDFDREVRILGKARHPNLMPLPPYLRLRRRRQPPGPPPRPPRSAPLNWAARFKIALGAAKGLAHLHQSFRPPIIHYNVKPGNILLDDAGDARLADFGLARLLPKPDRHAVGSRFQTALGYVAPEMACQSLRVNERCDVYGFGVVVLELVTGRRPVEYGEDDVVILVDQVRALLERGAALDCVDPRLGPFPEDEVLPVLKLGLVCTSQIPSSRPPWRRLCRSCRS